MLSGPLRVLVTGGAGFIGANLVRELVLRGHVVIAFDDLSGGSRANLNGVDAHFVEGSILDEDLLDRNLRDADAVVHLAARGSVPRSVAEPVVTNRVNVDGTLAVLEAARRQPSPPHLVFASSSSVYGANPVLPKSEDVVPMPVSPYAVSKLAGEQYALAYAHSYGLDVLAFRFFNVYGPFQPAGHAYAAVVPVFVDAALAGRALPVHGDGMQTRDFTFVGTVAEALCGAVEGRVTHCGAVNLAFGTRHSLLDVVASLGSLLGRSLEISFADSRAGDVRDSQADTARLRSLFPDVEPVSLTDGLGATLAWFRSTAARSG